MLALICTGVVIVVITSWACSLVGRVGGSWTVAASASADVVVFSAAVTGQELTRLTWLRINVGGHGLAIVTIWADGRSNRGRTDLTRAARLTIIDSVGVWTGGLLVPTVWAHVVLTIVTVVRGRVSAHTQVLNVASFNNVGTTLSHNSISVLWALHQLDTGVVVILE